MACQTCFVVVRLGGPCRPTDDRDNTFDDLASVFDETLVE